MRSPSVQDLPEAFAKAARSIAEAMRSHGHAVWIVGGAVRDLALEREVADLDLATPATPDEIEVVLPPVHAVGRAFGTLVLRQGDVDVQITTFRREGAYSDGRHPDQVEFSTRLEDDAERRDFTCNALFLEPLSDEVRDPTGGLADLAAGRLRCVGRAADRFAEDGLRIFRLARFAARFGLEVEPATLDAAHDHRALLSGVSPERVVDELTNLATKGGAAGALALLDRLGALQEALGALWGAPAGERAGDLALLERLQDEQRRLTVEQLFWVLARGLDDGPALAALTSLRVPGRVVSGVLSLRQSLAALRSADGRAARVRVLRAPDFDAVLTVAEASAELSPEAAGAWRAARAKATVSELWPEPWITSEVLLARGVAPGPGFGELLAAAEHERLAGRHPDRTTALDWLAQELARSQEGGKTRRKA